LYTKQKGDQFLLDFLLNGLYTWDIPLIVHVAQSSVTPTTK
jgi:hypothetical protein